MLHAFPGRAICDLNLIPNFKEWAPYLGPFTRADDIVLNTERRKVNKGNGKLEKECREMSQERILEMLFNDLYLQVKNTAKRCKISTAGSKTDIIMRLKSVLTRDAHLPNIVVVDMAHIVAKHANRSRREDNEKYNKGDNERKLFRPYDGRAADPVIKDNVKKANDGTLSVSYPWMPNTGSTSKQSNFKKDAHPVTGSDARLCLFHERNSSSEIETLPRNGNIPELNGLFNSEIEEQLHLKFDSDKKFLNMMTQITHIYIKSP